MQSDKQTLLILTPGFPKEENGTYLVLSQQLLVKALLEQFPGWNLVIVSFYFPEEAASWNWHGARVISLGKKKYPWQKIFRRRRIFQQLRDLAAEYKLAGVLSFWCGECAWIGKRFARELSLLHRVWICGQDARATNKWVHKIKPHASELVAMSPFLAEEFNRNHGIRPALIIHNGIDPNHFPSGQARDRDIDILGAGSLIPLKQYPVFTWVVEQLCKSRPGLRAMLCGDGPEKDRLEQQIEKNGIRENLVLAGSTAHPELLRTMQRARIFLHTSSYEGFSTVCLEALYAGAQVISFCDPLGHPVPNWFVVMSKEEMLRQANELLSNTAGTTHSPVLLYSIRDSAGKFMDLFTHQNSTV